ncbi:hypothetical protein EPIB2_369 [Tritonibacter mobilis]|nr:hypothetical protein EPIB2_369 [Tritonibacter mobilis]
MPVAAIPPMAGRDRVLAPAIIANAAVARCAARISNWIKRHSGPLLRTTSGRLPEQG